MINHLSSFFIIAESLISRFSIQGELGVTANWTQYTSRQSAKEIEFEYRVTCAANYYGPGCGTLCRERDDNFGHIACSASGQKICLSGWQGEYCTERKCFFIQLSARDDQQLCWLSLYFRVYYFISFAYYNGGREEQSLEFKYQSLT